MGRPLPGLPYSSLSHTGVRGTGTTGELDTLPQLELSVDTEEAGGVSRDGEVNRLGLMLMQGGVSNVPGVSILWSPLTCLSLSFDVQDQVKKSQQSTFLSSCENNTKGCLSWLRLTLSGISEE